MTYNILIKNENLFFSPSLSTYHENIDTISTASASLKKQDGSYFENKFNFTFDYDLRDKKYKQVVVDSSLGVAYNVVIGGGLHVEGELTCQHITGPAQLNQTENVILKAEAKSTHTVGRIEGTAYGVTADGMAVTINNWIAAPVKGSGFPDTIEVAPHQHGYKTVGMTMMSNSDGVRTAGQACLLPQKVGPQPVENEDSSDLIQSLLDEIPLPDIDIGIDTEIA